jgi:hypothetical protein
MRFSRLVVPALTAFAFMAAAHADGLAQLDSFTATSLPAAQMVKLCVTASGSAVGQPCFLSENGIQVGSMVLAPGANSSLAPNMGPGSMFVASGPGIEMAATASTSPGNLGIN